MTEKLKTAGSQLKVRYREGRSSVFEEKAGKRRVLKMLTKVLIHHGEVQRLKRVRWYSVKRL